MNIYETSEPRVAHFLQTWLFFGLLTEVLQSNITTDDFLKEGGKFITTKKLPEHVLEWKKSLAGLDEEEKLEQFQHNLRCFQVAESVLFYLPLRNEPLLAELTPEFHICMGSVLQCLIRANASVYGMDNATAQGIDDMTKELGHYSTDNCLDERMERQGWCPNEIDFLRQDADVDAFYFMSNIPRLSTRDHKACTEEKCIAFTPEGYVTQHREKTCQCEVLFANQDQMLRILQRGSFPLISFHDARNASTEDPELRTIDSGKAKRYVAISHVWSDGMGNNEHNALPRCVLSFISQAVQSLYPSSEEPVPFWMDTICFPLEPPEAYNMAMSKMRASYEDADQVLVLDSSLQLCHSKTIPIHERLIHVLCSGWMRRLWTLQEAQLAAKLQFQFSDSIMNIDDALEEALEGVELPFQHALSSGQGPPSGFKRYLWKLRVVLRSKPWTKSKSSMTIVAPAIQRRSTSVSTDEPLCLATLLNLDIDKILAVPANKRMKEMLALLDAGPGITRGALFAPGPKIKAKGFGWAPTTILNPSSSPVICRSLGQEAKLDKEGLSFMSGGFLLIWKKPVTDIFNFKDLEGNRFRVVPDQRPISWADTDCDSQSQEAASCPQFIALIVRDKLEQTSILNHINPASGVLVAVERREADIVFVRYVTSAMICPSDKNASDAFELADRCLLYGVDQVLQTLPADFPGSSELRDMLEKEIAKGEWCGAVGVQTPSSQKWCCS